MSVITEKQRNYQEVRTEAVNWARELEFKSAAADIISLPIILPGYLIGFLWFAIKVLVGLFVFGFRHGARMPDKT